MGQDPLVGKKIREYEILEVIGQGGMGAVYRARHIYLEQERALKVIRSDRSANKEFVERFIREAKLLTRLRHPNLVVMHEFGSFEENSFFMVLELLQGETVLERIQRLKKIPYSDALRIVREAALGLQAAHAKGIVHRDISPDNLVVVKDESGDEVTKVIDFGIAKPLDSTNTLTSDLFVGKLEYSSPEQCGMLDSDEHLDGRSDMYSLGITFYHMLTGELPFRAQTAQALMVKHATENPKPPSTKTVELPPTLDTVVLRMLAKKRSDRYLTMEHFIRDLDQIQTARRNSDEQATIETSDETFEMRIGSLFAKRYMILSKLGEGGMGAVYKATDQILNVPMALKVLSSRVAHNPTAVERFKREVILARKVAHRNTCRIYDIGESDGIHYVSMEYIEGKTLSHLMAEKGRLDPQLGISIMSQVLEGLEEAHHAGIIHRDLKPQNIMVNDRNHAWIMDFGISISNEVSRVTQTGVVVGTVYYMAPEQLDGKEIDARADIYSIGVILYQMFTEKLPFQGTTSKEFNPMQQMLAQLHSTATRPSEIIPNFPPELEKIILRALEKNPDKRFQTANEVKQALHRIANTAETLDVSVIQPAPKPKTDVLKFAIIGLVILVLATAWFLFRRPVVTEPQKPSIPSPAAVTLVGVNLNALPWAKVKIIPVSKSVQFTIPAEEKVTPCFLNLPEGDYSVELSNDGSTQTLSNRIHVQAGRDNSFQFVMPAYEPVQAMPQVGELR
ncbi:MAG: hypothetical protein C5B54_09840 [Acidobacteria bacterium]|nr:MAG: hypothetical protein C5B54_09840 [Acidobacteriota bacterium]